MIDWNKYIKLGKFISTNGIYLPFKWEFNKLEQEKQDSYLIISKILQISSKYQMVAIHSVHPKQLEKCFNWIFYPKKNILLQKEKYKLQKYIIYDDVVTTGKSIQKCINYIRIKPEFCICLVDRTEYTNFKLDFKLISLREMKKI